MIYQQILGNYLEDDSNTLFYDDGKNKFTWSDASNYISYLISEYLIEIKNQRKDLFIASKKSFETYCLIMGSYLLGITFNPIDYRDEMKISKLDSGTVLFSKINYEFLPFIKLDFYEFRSNLFTKSGFFKNFKNIYHFDNENAVYKMSSSGSTGEPKVIPINSINLENYINQINKIANFKKGDNFAQIANLTFDLSMHDLFLSFFHKGTLIPIGTEMGLFLTRFIKKMNINHIMTVPSFLDLGIKNKNSFENNVNNIFVCGEALRTDVAKRISTIFPKANCFNLYGPTECTIAVLYFKFSGEKINFNSDQIPIGKPFIFNEVFLSENNELLISGKQVFEGYFSKNRSPFVLYKNMKFYRTGDICKLEKNNYYFVGRIGSQIKYRGYRIDIEGLEIYLSKSLKTEIILIAHNEISKCNYKEITIFHSHKDLKILNIKELLPPHLNSVFIKYIYQIPRTKSYKVNRKKIKVTYL